MQRTKCTPPPTTQIKPNGRTRRPPEDTVVYRRSTNHDAPTTVRPKPPTRRVPQPTTRTPPNAPTETHNPSPEHNVPISQDLERYVVPSPQLRLWIPRLVPSPCEQCMPSDVLMHHFKDLGLGCVSPEIRAADTASDPTLDQPEGPFCMLHLPFSSPALARLADPLRALSPRLVVLAHPRIAPAAVHALAPHTAWLLFWPGEAPPAHVRMVFERFYAALLGESAEALERFAWSDAAVLCAARRAVRETERRLGAFASPVICMHERVLGYVNQLEEPSSLSTAPTPAPQPAPLPFDCAQLSRELAEMQRLQSHMSRAIQRARMLTIPTRNNRPPTRALAVYAQIWARTPEGPREFGNLVKIWKRMDVTTQLVEPRDPKCLPFGNVRNARMPLVHIISHGPNPTAPDDFLVAYGAQLAPLRPRLVVLNMCCAESLVQENWGAIEWILYWPQRVHGLYARAFSEAFWSALMRLGREASGSLSVREECVCQDALILAAFDEAVQCIKQVYVREQKRDKEFPSYPTPGICIRGHIAYGGDDARRQCIPGVNDRAIQRPKQAVPGDPPQCVINADVATYHEGLHPVHLHAVKSGDTPPPPSPTPTSRHPAPHPALRLLAQQWSSPQTSTEHAALRSEGWGAAHVITEIVDATRAPGSVASENGPFPCVHVMADECTPQLSEFLQQLPAHETRLLFLNAPRSASLLQEDALAALPIVLSWETDCPPALRLAFAATFWPVFLPSGSDNTAGDALDALFADRARVMRAFQAALWRLNDASEGETEGGEAPRPVIKIGEELVREVPS